MAGSRALARSEPLPWAVMLAVLPPCTSHSCPPSLLAPVLPTRGISPLSHQRGFIPVGFHTGWPRRIPGTCTKLPAWQWDATALGGGMQGGMAAGSLVQQWELAGGDQDGPTAPIPPPPPRGRQRWDRLGTDVSSRDVPSEEACISQSQGNDTGSSQREQAAPVGGCNRYRSALPSAEGPQKMPTLLTSPRPPRVPSHFCPSDTHLTTTAA